MNAQQLLTIPVRSEQDVVLVRQRARELAAALGFERQTQTSIATALSEIARNAFQYAGGGEVAFSASAETTPSGKPRQAFLIVVRDRGGGIENLEAILGGRYRSSTGMGIGIVGTRRLMDRADFETSPKGTTVTMAKVLPPSAPLHTTAQLQAIAARMGSHVVPNSTEEVVSQNRELLRALDEMRQKEEELQRVNTELTETNTGVLALYDELETLHRIGVTLASKLELKALIQTIVEVTTSLTNANLGVFFFHDVESGEWTLFASSDAALESDASIPAAQPADFFDGLGESGMLHLRNIAAAEMPPYGRLISGVLEVRSILAVPVIDSEGALVGALAFASVKPDGFSERSERILTSVATQASVGIEKARLFQSVTAASVAKDEFLAMLSHELRTPLNPVLAILTALKNDPRVTPDIGQELAVVLRNVLLEARLIDDLLDFNRLIKDKVDIVREPLDVHALIENVIVICHDEINAKQQNLVVRLDAPRSVVLGDSPRLQQVLWNVLRNANKFTPPGGRISIHTSEHDGRLRIDLNDTGRGLERSALEKIFRAFEQAGDHPPAHFGGLGLGLAIARKFVELHDGTIRATSSGLGHGSTFSIELPLSEAEPAAASHQPRPKTRTGKTARILLIDDHADTLAALTRLLARKGYAVTGARSGEEAREQMSRGTFDLLISDLGLPDCSGVDLVRELRSRQPIPAIALTGYGMEGDRASTAEAGFQAHIIKPVDFDQLIGLIESLL